MNWCEIVIPCSRLSQLLISYGVSNAASRTTISSRCAAVSFWSRDMAGSIS